MEPLTTPRSPPRSPRKPPTAPGRPRKSPHDPKEPPKEPQEAPHGPAGRWVVLAEVPNAFLKSQTGPTGCVALGGGPQTPILQPENSWNPITLQCRGGGGTGKEYGANEWETGAAFGAQS